MMKVISRQVLHATLVLRHSVQKASVPEVAARADHRTELSSRKQPSLYPFVIPVVRAIIPEKPAKYLIRKTEHKLFPPRGSFSLQKITLCNYV